MEYLLNADIRKSSTTILGGSANLFGGNADLRRLTVEYICDHLRVICENLR